MALAPSSKRRRNAMQLIALGLALAVTFALALTQASAQGPTSGVERLYILNCGEGVAGDISRWSPGVNVGKSMDFADNCYLIKHAQGWMLWDTGVTDAIAAMPEGPAAHRSANDALAAAEDACRAARSARRETFRHQIRRRLAHPSRPHRQRDDVPAEHAPGAEGRVRMAVAGRSALQTGPSCHQARGRTRCFW